MKTSFEKQNVRSISLIERKSNFKMYSYGEYLGRIFYEDCWIVFDGDLQDLYRELPKKKNLRDVEECMCYLKSKAVNIYTNNGRLYVPSKQF